MATVDRMVHLPVSIMVGKSREMDRAAEGVRDRVIANAMRHRLSGAYIGSIKIGRVRGRQGNGLLVTDRLVFTTDPGALSIEYGHKNSRSGKFVPGQYIFTRASSAVDATGGA